MGFLQATAVTRVDDDEFGVDVDPGTWVVRGPNGGIVAAWMLRAMTERVGDPNRAPRSLTVHYPSSPEEGPATVRTAIERQGRSIAYLSSRLEQDGKVRAIALGAFSPAWDTPVTYEPPAPEMPVGRDVSMERPPLPFLAMFEQAMVDTPEGWDVAQRMRPKDGTIDAAAVAAMTDACMPTILLRAELQPVVPTVDLTVHFRRALPVPGPGGTEPVLSRFRTRTCVDGLWEEDGEVWSATGELLAQSRQLSVIL